MGKDMKYLTCKEFVDLCGITKNTLVWYEKKGLITPKAVGENGYHYYSREQYFDIDLIKSLKWADKSLSDCKNYMDNRSGDNFLSLLLAQQEVLDQKMLAVSQQKKIVDRSIQDYLSMQSRFTEQPKLVEHPNIHLLVNKIDDKTPRGYILALNQLFDVFHSCLELQGAAPSMLNGAMLLSKDVISGDYFNLSFVTLKINAPIAHESYQLIPKGTFATCFHKGPPKSISATYHRLMTYIDANNLEIVGNILENDFINYLSSNKSEEFVKEILIPVQQKSRTHIPAI